MAINGVAGAPAAAADPAGASVLGGMARPGGDLFLKLMVAQMRYQNPFAADQDTGQMITQLALFSMLEQVLKIQRELETQGQAAARAGALGLLNRTVRLLGDDGELIAGPVTAVSFSQSQPALTVNGREHPYSALIMVEEGDDDHGGTDRS